MELFEFLEGGDGTDSDETEVVLTATMVAATTLAMKETFTVLWNTAALHAEWFLPAPTIPGSRFHASLA